MIGRRLCNRVRPAVMAWNNHAIVMNRAIVTGLAAMLNLVTAVKFSRVIVRGGCPRAAFENSTRGQVWCVALHPDACPTMRRTLICPVNAKPVFQQTAVCAKSTAQVA